MLARSILLLVLCVAACTKDPSPTKETAAESPNDARPNTVTFARSAGGSMKTNLGYGIVLNDKSSMNREWITAQDTTLPARMSMTGARTIYASRGSYSSGYQYAADVSVEALEALAAVEVRLVLFDIWGEFLKTLTMTDIRAIPAGTTVKFDPRWDLYSENEASEFYASIAYIARVRTQAGKVFEANESPIVEEARKLSDRFTPEQLDPYRRPPRDSVRTVAGTN